MNNCTARCKASRRDASSRALERRLARYPFTSGVLAVAAAFALLTTLPSAAAGGASVWFDSDGDGLPQSGDLLAVSSGANLTLDVWINSGSFQWTNYLLYIEWDGCMSLSEPEYVIGGGTAFPIDDFSQSYTVGFGGYGFNEHGSDLIGRVKVTVGSPAGCCIRPLTEVDDEGVVSQLGADVESYRLFDRTDGLCFESLDSRQERTWGGVKSLYK